MPFRGASNPTRMLLGCLQRPKAKFFGAYCPSPTFLQQEARGRGGAIFWGEGEVILGVLAEIKQCMEKVGLHSVRSGAQQP